MTDAEKAAFEALVGRVTELEASSHDPPVFIRSVSDPTVFVAVGATLVSVKDGVTWQKLNDLGYAKATRTLPDNDPIWKLQRTTF